MLSRVANTFYWMVRHVERADNLARLIDVNQQLLLDSEELDRQQLNAIWEPIIQSAGDDEAFHALHADANSAEAVDFLALDRRNPNSVCSCVAHARENARMVRDQLSDELWEELNSLYLFVNSADASRMLSQEPVIFHQTIRRSAVTFLGIAASTLARNEAWEFMSLGRHLERADKTTRFLDINSYLPVDDESPRGASFDALHWSAILRSCGALGAYRVTKREIDARGVFDFLVFAREFPRSVSFCIERVDQALHCISGSPQGSFVNEAERRTGKLLAELNFGSTEEAFDIGLHSTLDGLQQQFNAIGDAIFESFVLMPEKFQVSIPSDPSSPSASALSHQWQMQQMQQQQ